jgi:hypothetical protein
MNCWLGHDPSSSLALVFNLPAALMPRFGRADNIRRYDFRAHLKDVLRSSNSCEHAQGHPPQIVGFS